MIQIAQLNLDEAQSLLIADAILLLAGIIKDDPTVYHEAAKAAAHALADGAYTIETLDECVKMVDKLADTWDPT